MFHSILQTRRRITASAQLKLLTVGVAATTALALATTALLATGPTPSILVKALGYRLNDDGDRLTIASSRVAGSTKINDSVFANLGTALASLSDYFAAMFTQIGIFLLLPVLIGAAVLLVVAPRVGRVVLGGIAVFSLVMVSAKPVVA